MHLKISGVILILCLSFSHSADIVGYRIVAQHAPYAITHDDAKNVVNMQRVHNADTQIWLLNKKEYGSVGLIAKGTGKSLTITGGRCWEGSILTTDAYTGESHQQFIIHSDGTIHPVCNEDTFIVFSDFQVEFPSLRISHKCENCEKKFTLVPIYGEL